MDINNLDYHRVIEINRYYVWIRIFEESFLVRVTSPHLSTWDRHRLFVGTIALAAFWGFIGYHIVLGISQLIGIFIPTFQVKVKRVLEPIRWYISVVFIPISIMLFTLFLKIRNSKNRENIFCKEFTFGKPHFHNSDQVETIETDFFGLLRYSDFKMEETLNRGGYSFDQIRYITREERKNLSSKKLNRGLFVAKSGSTLYSIIPSYVFDLERREGSTFKRRYYYNMIATHFRSSLNYPVSDPNHDNPRIFHDDFLIDDRMNLYFITPSDEDKVQTEGKISKKKYTYEEFMNVIIFREKLPN